LHFLGQGIDLAPLLLVGRRDAESQQMAQGIDSQMDFGAAPAFGTVIARSRAAFGRRWQGPAVENCRRGLRPVRPWASRNTARRSCTMVSNTPAVSQRWLCWYIVGQGGRSCGIIHHAAPVRTIQRRLCSRWGLRAS
jgi:hypothetical protein